MEVTLEDLELRDLRSTPTVCASGFRRNSISELDGARLGLGMPDSATALSPWMELEERMPTDRTELPVLEVLPRSTAPLWKDSRLPLEEDLSRRAEVRVWCTATVDPPPPPAFFGDLTRSVSLLLPPIAFREKQTRRSCICCR